MGKETIKLERMFNEAAGFTAEDDRLPDFFKEPAKEGGLPPFPYSDEVVQKGINSIYAYYVYKTSHVQSDWFMRG